MARITVEDCLDKVENRFELVMLATKRARQIATGGRDPLVQADSDKPTVIALREIAEGLITDANINVRIETVFEEDDEEELLLVADAEAVVSTDEPAQDAAEESGTEPLDVAEESDAEPLEAGSGEEEE